MSGKISQYTEALSVANDDFFDVSIDTGGGVYATRKVRKSNLGIGGNFADTDLTFTGNRTHDLGNNQLLIDGDTNGGTSTSFRVNTNGETLGVKSFFQIDDEGCVEIRGNNSTNGALKIYEDRSNNITFQIKIQGDGYWLQRSGNPIYIGQYNASRIVHRNNYHSFETSSSVEIHRLRTSGGSTTSFLMGTGFGSGTITIGATSPVGTEKISLQGTTYIGDQLTVQGSGSTSATTTVLFENSSGTDLFKVDDDGGFLMQDGTYTFFYNDAGGRISMGRGTSVDANSFLTVRNQSGRQEVLKLENSDGSTRATIGTTAEFYHSLTGDDYNIFKAEVGVGAILEQVNNSVIENRFATDNSSYMSGYFKIGGTTRDSSSALDIESTVAGFLPPRMTTTQKNAISTPATGLVVYDSTLNKLCVYTGASWETVTSA